MRFQLVTGVEYDIKFGYMFMPESGTTNTICTICNVDQRVPTGRARYLPATMGVAEQSPKDKFVKDVGRRISLARTLKKGGFHKDLRKKAWEAYLNRKNK